jgi:hypothetical protein
VKNSPRGLLIPTIALSLSTAAFAQTENTDLGKKEYDLKCGFCHGADAKGDGVFGANLKVAPPDLTVLAKKNGGVFSSRPCQQRDRRTRGDRQSRVTRHADLGHAIRGQCR